MGHGIRQKGTPGVKFTDADGKVIVPLYCTQAVTKGRPYVMSYSGTYGPQATTPATEVTHHKNEIVIALETAAINTIALFQIGGPVEEAYVYTAAVGDHLEVLNAGTYLVVDGTSGSTTRSIKSTAICMEANALTSAALVKIWKFENTNDIAAS